MSIQQLERVFETFATFGDRLQKGLTMDCARFAKVARDCKLLDSIMTPTQVDLIFSRVKPKAARRIGFQEFLIALDIMAGIKYGNDPDGGQTIRNAIVYAGGPLLDGVHLPKTSGVFDKLTDAALFTGSHKERFDESGSGLGASGRRHEDETVSDLSQITRPDFRGGTHLSSATANRRSAGPNSPNRSPGGADKRPTSSATYGTHASSHHTQDAPSRQQTPRVVIESQELHAIFTAYCAFGATSKMLDELDNARFAKLCRESGLCDGSHVTGAAVDLAFSRAKEKGKRTISYDEAQQALAILAPQRFPKEDIVGALQSSVELIIVAGGPAFKTAALPQTGGVFDKLTDPRQYPASHRERMEDRLVAAGVLPPKLASS